MTDTTEKDTTEIRRRPDGSIDTRYYMQIGHQCRSEAFFESGRMAARTGSILARVIDHIRSRSVPDYLRDSVAKA